MDDSWQVIWAFLYVVACFVVLWAGDRAWHWWRARKR